jgi:hypothetical protein
MTQVIQYHHRRRSLAASAPLTDEQIKKQRWRKHIEEISRHLATEPIQSEDPTFEQQEWLEFRMANPFPKPCRPWGAIEIPYKWIEREKTNA